jgi:IS30 family transposase
MLSDRPDEVARRAMPEHFGRDLIIDEDAGSVVGALVERSTRWVMLLPHRSGAEVGIVAIDRKIVTHRP